MKTQCKKKKNINLNNIESIEKWILDDCNCTYCNGNQYITNMLQSIKIKKENTIQLDELILTGKMIIKIKMEIVKKQLMETLSNIG